VSTISKEFRAVIEGVKVTMDTPRDSWDAEKFRVPFDPRVLYISKKAWNIHLKCER